MPARAQPRSPPNRPPPWKPSGPTPWHRGFDSAVAPLPPSPPHLTRGTLSIVVPVPSASGASPETADAVIAFTGVDVEHSGEDLVSLYAQDDATDSEVALVVQGPDVLGSIRRGAEVYKVHPLGDGLTAVYRYDTSRLRRHPPGWGRFMRRNEPMRRQAPQAPDTPPPGDAGTSGAAADTGDVIDLLVAYTPAARRAAGNIDAFIQFAIDNTHRIYRNSNIGLRLRLVHKHQVNYAEHSIMGVDLDRLTDIDGTMDEVHGLRDRYGADLVALIVGRSSNRVCGVAWVPDFGAARITIGVMGDSVSPPTTARRTPTTPLRTNSATTRALPTIRTTHVWMVLPRVLFLLLRPSPTATAAATRRRLAHHHELPAEHTGRLPARNRVLLQPHPQLQWNADGRCGAA